MTPVPCLVSTLSLSHQHDLKGISWGTISIWSGHTMRSCFTQPNCLSYLPHDHSKGLVKELPSFQPKPILSERAGKLIVECMFPTTHRLRMGSKCYKLHYQSSFPLFLSGWKRSAFSSCITQNIGILLFCSWYFSADNHLLAWAITDNVCDSFCGFFNSVSFRISFIYLAGNLRS